MQLCIDQTLIASIENQFSLDQRFNSLYRAHVLDYTRQPQHNRLNYTRIGFNCQYRALIQLTVDQTRRDLTASIVHMFTLAQTITGDLTLIASIEHSFSLDQTSLDYTSLHQAGLEYTRNVAAEKKITGVDGHSQKQKK